MDTLSIQNVRLEKRERLCSKRTIESLFGGGSKSFSAYPVRVVFKKVDTQQEPVTILVSVSKRYFKRAVKRNRVKRQIREAYRLNKHILSEVLSQDPSQAPLAVAFLWQSYDLADSSVVAAKMKNLLIRMSEHLMKERNEGTLDIPQ